MKIKRRSLTSGAAQSADVDLTPIMCLFIILVPLLLLTAVFEKLSALKVNLPQASTLEVADKSPEKPSGIIEIRLLIQEEGLGLEGTLSHDPAGREKETYEDFRYEIPLKGDRYDFPQLQKILKGLKQEYPRHEEVIFLVEDKVAYDIIVQAMDTCREENYLEDGERKSRALFPTIALSEKLDEEKGFDGIREGTREINKKLGIR